MVISTSQPLGIAIIGISYRHMKGKIIMHYKIVRGKAGCGFGSGKGRHLLATQISCSCLSVAKLIFTDFSLKEIG